MLSCSHAAIQISIRNPVCMGIDAGARLKTLMRRCMEQVETLRVEYTFRLHRCCEYQLALHDGRRGWHASASARTGVGARRRRAWFRCCLCLHVDGALLACVCVSVCVCVCVRARLCVHYLSVRLALSVSVCLSVYPSVSLSRTHTRKGHLIA